MDWNNILTKQADTARRAVQSVPRILSHPALSFDQCTRLLTEITSTRFKLDMIQARIVAEGAPLSFTTVAAQLGQIWAELSNATAQRLKAFDEPIAA
ncbi:hypothetical protein DTW90_36490 [Neorhizobium sp. P12A]|uniref:hypothetical protein n=1 Tax=Neorhizobium sp. P12A TaxID=2268027 RepID=UPI0011ED0F21|nr:hypothetical protein [Neorhizobium sp. P12A]KAA0683694.1 hypothetical protein DTW90_36490 [Neorhizobium sp. P12A]